MENLENLFDNKDNWRYQAILIRALMIELSQKKRMKAVTERCYYDKKIILQCITWIH